MQSTVSSNRSKIENRAVLHELKPNQDMDCFANHIGIFVELHYTPLTMGDIDRQQVNPGVTLLYFRYLERVAV